MKKFIRISLPILAILMSCAMPGQAESVHGGGGGARGGSGGHYSGGGGHYYSGHGYYYGGRWGWGPGSGVTWGLGYPYYGYPYYGYPYYPYYDAAPVVVEQPATEVYVQPAPQQTAPTQPVETGYWYYCQNPQGYYPYVKECPNGWMKVVPSPPPPQR